MVYSWFRSVISSAHVVMALKEQKEAGRRRPYFFIWSNWKAATTANSSQDAELEHTPWARVHPRSFGRVQMGFPNATNPMAVGSSPTSRLGWLFCENTQCGDEGGFVGGAEPRRNCGGTGAAPVRHRCGTGAALVRHWCAFYMATCAHLCLAHPVQEEARCVSAASAATRTGALLALLT